MLGGECFRALNQDIGAGDDLDRVKGRAAANICWRDIASSDDADVQCFHRISFFVCAGDRIALYSFAM